MSFPFDPQTEERIAAEVERRLAAHLAEHHEVQQKLEHLASIPDFNPNPVIEIDARGEVISCNRAAAEVFEHLAIDDREAAALLAGNPEESCAIDAPPAVTNIRQHEVRIKDRSFTVSCHVINPPGNIRIYAHDITEHRRAAEALRESEERYRALVNASSQVLYRMSPDWSEMRQLQGGSFIADTEKPNRNWLREYIHPDDQQWVREVIEKAVGTGTVFELEHRVRRVDGTLGWTFSRAVPVRDAAGAIVEWFGAASDITERKQAEEALRRSEEHLRAVLDNLVALVGVMTPDGTLIEANRVALEMGGLQAEEVVGKPFEETFWWSWSSEVQEQLRTAIRKAAAGEASRYDVMVRMAGGRMIIIDFMLAPLCDEQGRVKYLIPSALDVTERKRTEEALRESEVRFRALADNISQFAWMADEKGCTFWYNKRWYEYTGTTFAEMEGWGWRQVHHPEHVDRVVEKFSRYLATGEAWEDAFPLRGKDGQYRWFLSRAVPIRDEQGRVLRWFGTNTDITDLREAQLAIEKTVDELGRSNRELEQFAYIASHDLQTPLRSITGFLDLLSRRYKGKLDPEADEFIGYAVEGAERMHQLINDILAYSRVGTRGNPFERLESREPLDRALGHLRAEIEESGAGITVGELPAVTGDRNQLTQLFQNLIGNAIKYRKKDEPPRIHVAAEEKAGEWEFRVQDNSIGIAPRHRERIFQIFQRLHTVSDYPGTGIGLAICRKIVERHGGRIWVESEPGKGSTFYFTWPQDRG